ncbi:MAG: PIN domain-containing protein [Sulfurovum sp.]
MLYMLDTNICSYIIRNKPQSIKSKLQEVEENHTVALSSIVVSELLYGATKKDSPKLTRIISAFIDNFIIYDYSKTSAQSYANIRTDLEKKGTIIGANDLLIASHALSLEAVLVTNNIREFKRVEKLLLEDWSL